MRVIITSPSLDTTQNVSGVAAVTQFIISHNTSCQYRHFALGKRDGEVRGLRWFLRTFAVSLKWVYVLFREDRAIIHFNLALEVRSLLRDSPLIMVARLLHRRMIVHLHGGELLSRCGHSIWLKGLVKIVAGRGAVIVLSGIEQQVLGRMVHKSKIFVLPNCIALDQAMAFRRTREPDEPLTVLFLGRISRRKGIGLIYDAFVALRRGGARVRLVMAGSGPEEDYYLPKFRQLLGDDFEFPGVVAGAGKTEVLKKCNVFLLPSLFEGMPMALLESMAFGLVPIATSVGSIPAVVTHGTTGILLNSPDPQEIVSAIRSLAADKRRMETLSQNARRHVFQHFQASAYCAELNAIYQHE